MTDVKSFYKEIEACERGGREEGEYFPVKVCLKTGMCYVSMDI